MRNGVSHEPARRPSPKERTSGIRLQYPHDLRDWPGKWDHAIQARVDYKFACGRCPPQPSGWRGRLRDLTYQASSLFCAYQLRPVLASAVQEVNRVMTLTAN
jgi:hypothetical protein